MIDEIARLKRILFSLQAESGAFLSEVRNGEVSLPDYNGFVTALVLREMEGFADPGCAEPLNLALDFLQECEGSCSGMCSFWPPGRSPSWAPYNPEECDSTAVIAAELFHFGRITPERARCIALGSMPGFQTTTGDFLAWRSQGVVPNPVDLVLNVNVVAFLAQTGCRGSGVYRNACRAICDTVAYREDSPRWLDQRTPYYPETAEVFLAIHNALRRGARELLPVAAALQPFFVATADDRAKTLFANEGRRTLWSSEAVLVARRIRRHTERR